MTDRKLIDLPSHCQHLERDPRGYPIPEFVGLLDGERDFRIMNPQHFLRAIKKKLCWICGKPLTRYLAFPIGPMCAVNRITSEPPNHLDCAEFAAKNCPFLSNPMAKRRERDLPQDLHVAGNLIPDNPGVVCMWITLSYEPFQITRPGQEGILFRLGKPVRVEWWSRGRAATRAEVAAAIDKGFPKLLATAQMDDDPEESTREMWQARKLAEIYLPL